MSIVLIAADDTAAQPSAIERKIIDAIPDVIKIQSIEDIARETPKPGGELTYVLFLPPPHSTTHVDRIVHIAERYRDRIFFIIVSSDISGNDYKRLIRTGGAEWVSSNAPPNEILDIIAQHKSHNPAEPASANRPSLISFVPSAGGVGNSTLAIEVATQLMLGKTKQRVCLLDLDFQTSHVCDYLDIQPHLQIEEISSNPARLDNQLLDVFISKHSSGLDVFAAPRTKFDLCTLNFSALDKLFEMLAHRYDLILIDFPVNWSTWTPKILAASQAIIVTGLNSIPGLRQAAETVACVRALDGTPSEIQIIINRCELGAFGRIVRRQYVESVLRTEKLIFVREDAAINDAANTGTPNAISAPRRNVSKDIAKITQFCQNLKARPVKN
ncbi:MAG: AAA family ATPase [Xanthobacteraceae bacterium]